MQFATLQQNFMLVELVFGVEISFTTNFVHLRNNSIESDAN
jgi:hypothetical protein